MTMDDVHPSDEPALSLEFALSSLGPAFISPDDATYWAQRSMDDINDSKYGGLIFERDNRYYATQPTRITHEKSTIHRVIPVLRREGYSFFAIYQSRPTWEIEPDQPSHITADETRVLDSFFTKQHLRDILRSRHNMPVHYVCGPGGYLIKYVSLVSKAEDDLLVLLSQDSTKPVDTLKSIIPTLAETGELWVLNANPAWGGVRGRVTKDWMLGTPLTGSDQMQPFFSAVSQQPELDKLLPSGTAAEPAIFGYLLKVKGKEEYITALEPSERRQWVPPNEIFPARPGGGAKLPSTFRIEGFYYRTPLKDTALQVEFFTPATLAAAAKQLLDDPVLYDAQRGLTLFLRTADSALLSYTFSGTDAESDFLGPQGETAENQLSTGMLSSSEFVERLSEIGKLNVVQTGGQWKKTGRLLNALRVFKRLQGSFSPAFITADDAARYLHERIHDRSKDHLGYVLQRDDGLFVSTAPIAKSELGRQLGLSFGSSKVTAEMPLPEGYRYAGFFSALADNFESVLKLRSSVIDDQSRLAQGLLSAENETKLMLCLPHYGYTVSITAASQTVPTFYCSSPTGSLVKYVRSNTQAERNFSSFLLNSMNLGEIKPQLDGFNNSPQALVLKLVRLGELHVVVSNPVWNGTRGRLPSDWKAYQPWAPAEPAQAACSWVFQDPETAAEYGLDQLVSDSVAPKVSFLLKHLNSERYLVTLSALAPPVSAQPLFSPLKVFAADDTGVPILPADYAIHGLAYRSLPSMGLKVTQHWLYEGFITPADMALAIAASRESGSSLRALYLATRDGAQLRYLFSGKAEESRLYGVTPTGGITDNGGQADLVAGRLTPDEYIRQIAAAGELSVRRKGRLWDVEGVVDTLWKPFARYPEPLLSSPFLSADDAARFAHEQIGSRREGEYCGCILKTRDQRFVATLPLPCRGEEKFAIDGVFPTDFSGVVLVPEPYVMHGQYASCASVALLDTARMRRQGWSRHEAYVDWQLFNDKALYSLIGNRDRISVAYLSSAEDSLLAYDLTGSDAELALLRQVTPGPGGSPMAQRLDDGRLAPEAMVRELAEAGLRIVVASRLWGQAGTLPEHWQAFPADKAFERPEQAAFGAVFASVNMAVTDAHQRLRRGYDSTQTCFGFVLKHEDSEAYVVSQTVPADPSNPLFSLSSLFALDDTGAFIYPSGFKLHALFYARRWMPQQLPADEVWLARHFLSSADLYSAFFEAKRWRDRGKSLTLPVFISTLDNALLTYQARTTTTLFNAEKEPTGVFEDVHTRLANGKLTAQAFVRQVISSCWLDVIVPNECWDEVGRLGVDWLPYAHFNRRALSPAFFTQADAVRYAQARLGTPGDTLQGGLLLRRVDGLFVATEPLPVPEENFDPKWILPDEDVRVDWLAPSMSIVARYRCRRDTLPNFLLEGEALQVYRGMFSTDVLAKALECSHLWTHEYLLGADGSLISFTCNDPDSDLLSVAEKKQQSIQFQKLKQALAPDARSPHDPRSSLIEQHLREGRKQPIELVNQVLKAASMSVIQGSDLWGNAQKLGRGWLRAYGFTAPEQHLYAVADRACSPIFSDIDDVARYVHREIKERAVLTFGFIFKATNGHWMASLPVHGEDLQFELNRVLLRGVVPMGYTLQGMYLRAPEKQPEELNASPIYRAFIMPSALRAALRVLQHKAASGDMYWPLYLSCVDGALLKYQASVLDSDWSNENLFKAYVKRLNGDFNPADYVRKVAGAGSLQVVIPGEIWATQGPVSQGWTPRTMADYNVGSDERLALGPLFSHPDDAARYMWRRHHASERKAWLGALLKNLAGNTFLITDPVDDSGPSVPVGLRLDTPAYRRLFFQVMNVRVPAPVARYPKGYSVMGVQQLYKVDDTRERLANRYQEALAANFISQREFRAFVEMFRLDNVAGARYYFTPRNGALLVYLPSYQRSEGEMLLSGWMDAKTDKPKATPSEVITTLANAGNLYILEPDTFWQPRGHVGSQLILELRKEGH